MTFNILLLEKLVVAKDVIQNLTSFNVLNIDVVLIMNEPTDEKYYHVISLNVQHFRYILDT